MKILITGKPNWFEKDCHSAISYYRMLGPLADIARRYKNVEVYESATGYAAEIQKVDLVFLHTPNNDVSLSAIFYAKKYRRKVWVDLDDMIFADDIPEANAAWTYFNDPKAIKILDASIKQADVISVSTQTIKKRLIERYGIEENRIWVIHNAIPDDIWQSRSKFQHIGLNDVKRVVWRGSFTHEGDLLLYRNGIKPHAKLGYVFIGLKPWLLLKKYGGHLQKGDFIHNQWVKPVEKYLELFQSLHPHFVFVPLEENDFNRGKSNIAWLEGTFAGGACIAQSSMPEFAKVPTIQFSSIKSLDGLLKNAASNKLNDVRFERYTESKALIERKYLLSQTNELRMKLINSL